MHRVFAFASLFFSELAIPKPAVSKNEPLIGIPMPLNNLASSASFMTFFASEDRWGSLDRSAHKNGAAAV